MEKGQNFSIYLFIFFVEQFQVKEGFQIILHLHNRPDSNGLLGSAIPQGITMDRSISDE